MDNSEPTWNSQVKALFTAPYWIPQEQRQEVVKTWLGCMKGYLITLDDMSSVKDWSITIYNHLASQNMPLTKDITQRWPQEALELFRLWVNQGWRKTNDSPFDRATRIPEPDPSEASLRVRPDIASLNEEQLNIYRAKLDDLNIGDPDPESPWQKLAYIHTNWCLHYQEAFAFWHRAYLLYLEALIDHAIPYWDWMAKDASVDGNPSAGLPKAFLDETYIHPHSGESRPNPLRYAAAKDGRSKACVAGILSGPDCKYVQRNPLFYTTGKEQKEQRQKHYKMARLFQEQVIDALKFDSFSVPQGDPGYPWANIPAFTPPQPDKDYPYRDVNFDGLYEQPHDNYHGWIGADMADNSYTAFDPVFYSYHANIDRMLEQWLRQHPVAQYTSQVILQPFTSPAAAAVNFSSPDHWRYVSIGELAQDSRRIGYDYGTPVAPQFTGDTNAGKSEGTNSLQKSDTQQSAAHSLAPQNRSTNEDRSNELWLAFDGVRCTHDSYLIDVFLNQADAANWDTTADNPHYVGRFSRIGMGIADNKNRCIKQGVSRLLNATRNASRLSLVAESNIQCHIRVVHMDSNRELPEAEYSELPGFVPTVVWGDPRQPLSLQTNISSCCSPTNMNQ